MKIQRQKTSTKNQSEHQPTAECGSSISVKLIHSGYLVHQNKLNDPYYMNMMPVLAFWMQTSHLNLLNCFRFVVKYLKKKAVHGYAKGTFYALLWDTWQRCTQAQLFIAKVFPIRSRMPPLSCLCRRCVNRDLAGLHVLYLITDRVGHLGHQSEYLNTYKIGFSLTASLRLIKFGLPEHRARVKHIMHLPTFGWKSFAFQTTPNDILTWAGCKFLFNSAFFKSLLLLSSEKTIKNGLWASDGSLI